MLSVAMAKTDDAQHLPPQNLEAEEALLGAIMIDPRVLELCDQRGLRTDDFYRPSHRLIYETQKFLAERGTLDELALSNELKARNKIQSVGGMALIFDLARRTPTAANAKAYIDTVIDHAKLRSMVEAGNQIARWGYEHPDKIGKLVERSVQLVEQMAKSAQRTNGVVGDAVSLANWTAEHVNGTTDVRSKWPYPLPLLQDGTGGFGRGQLISIGAQPGVGKSAFKNQILLGLTPEVRVGIINLEMDREDEQIRFVSSMTGIDSRRIWQRDCLTKDERLAILMAAEELGDRKYEIHQGSKSVEAVRAIQRRHKYDVLMVDHFHKLIGTEDYSVMVRASHMMKDIAIDNDCAVISLFQLNKGDSPSDLPTIGRIKGGGAIHEDSDHVFFLHRKYNDKGYPTEKAEIICAKQRGGTSGWSIPLVFNESRVSFEQPKTKGDG